MKKAGGAKGIGPLPAPGTTKPQQAGGTEPDLAEVMVKLRALCPPGELPALWKEAELKRRLDPTERPLLAAALARLQKERQLLALAQGKNVSYLFAGALRGWLEKELPAAAAPGEEPVDLFAVYMRLVRQSGGFPDVKIAALRAELDPASGADLPRRLVERWRAGQATLSQGDWSLADEPTRAAAVELHGERYLLVRLEKEQG